MVLPGLPKNSPRLRDLAPSFRNLQQRLRGAGERSSDALRRVRLRTLLRDQHELVDVERLGQQPADPLQKLAAHPAGRGCRHHDPPQVLRLCLTSAQEPVLHPVIYDPRSMTRSFREMSPTTQQRLYHGSALLLPDGRVVVGGHRKAFNDRLPVENGRLELFSPPYLFRGPRPVILSAPVRVRHGQTFEVVTRAEDEIAEVTFVRMSTVTHQLNTDQRCFFLREIDYARIDDESRTLTVEAPVEPTLAPPGITCCFSSPRARQAAAAARHRSRPSCNWSRDRSLIDNSKRAPDAQIEPREDLQPAQSDSRFRTSSWPRCAAGSLRQSTRLRFSLPACEATLWKHETPRSRGA